MAIILGRKIVCMGKMAAVKTENVIMAEVLRWWKQRTHIFPAKLLTYVYARDGPNRLTALLIKLIIVDVLCTLLLRVIRPCKSAILVSCRCSHSLILQARIVRNLF